MGPPAGPVSLLVGVASAHFARRTHTHHHDINTKPLVTAHGDGTPLENLPEDAYFSAVLVLEAVDVVV